MLSELHVKNFALIEQADLEFREGLNILTGETGAGKSILIDSIAAALGGKTGKDMIRTGEESAYIELIFSVEGEDRTAALKELGVTPEEDGTLILSRKIMKNRSVLRINDEAVTAQKLRSITGLLIDIHGQSEHQNLLYPETHLKFVDLMGPEALKEQKIKCAGLYRRYAEIKNTLKKEADQAFREREKEILRYEIDEIREAGLKDGEEEALQTEYLKIRNFSRIRDALGEAAGALDTDAVSTAVRRVADVAEYAPELQDLSAQLEELDGLLTDARREVLNRLDEADCDDERLQAVSDRLDLIRRLQEKYGEDVPGILELAEKKEERLEFLISFEQNRSAMIREKAALEKELSETCGIITELRRATCTVLEKNVVSVLQSLNFESPAFQIRLVEKEEFGEDGKDSAEFFISTNPGEPLKPLRNVASGGELSRIMLALKSVLAEKDEIPTVIFDEIDTGISGRTAQMVAEKLSLIGRGRQVLCITHLPQIAAFADHHFLISKNSDGNRTRTGITEISGDGITRELSRLIGGAEITEGVLRTAEEMKLLAEKMKNRAGGCALS